MKDNHLELSPNVVASCLRKRPEDFTMTDIIGFIRSYGVKMVNFMYPAEDGRVKTLNFIINSLEYLETILSLGERVDGSSLFPSFVEAGNSDLYVIPRFRTAFLDPFAEIPTLSMLCSFYGKDGQPFECDPYQTVLKAAKVFRESTGMTFEAMGELEYYVITEEQPLFPGIDQRGYHESAPFAKLNGFRTECMSYIAQTGGQIKYGHSEVGNFTRDGKTYEQNEIEFLPCPIETAADQVLLAKWVIRGLGLRHGLDVTFAPKIIVGEAGSGMHIHTRMMKDGHSCMVKDGKLSETAMRAIAGMLELAPAITAFGNKNPTSYFRLVPHQEAPTNICWGDCNRSALVRVPLGWSTTKDMCADANPLEHSTAAAGKRQIRTEINDDDKAVEISETMAIEAATKQTVEMRSPDSSADIYQLMAGLCTACRHGLEMPVDRALDITRKNYAGLNIHTKGSKDFAELPGCCAESADCLENAREIFEAHHVFSSRMIDGIIRSLRAFGDKGLLSRIEDKPSEVAALVRKYFYCG